MINVTGLRVWYTIEDGWLRGGVTLTALSRFVCVQCLCFRDSDLSQDQTLWLVAVRWAFLPSALVILGRFRTFIGVPKEFGMGAFQYRMLGKEEYVLQLATLDLLLISSRAHCSDVEDSALCFSEPQLSVDFGFIDQSSLPYWMNYVGKERRILAATGYEVSYQCVTHNNIAAARRKFSFSKLAAEWSRIELPIGCYAELSSISTYAWSALMDRRAVFWFV